MDRGTPEAMRGFSTRNLWDMRRFFGAYGDGNFLRQAVAEMALKLSGTGCSRNLFTRFEVREIVGMPSERNHHWQRGKTFQSSSISFN